jgi:amino-acid N-acetyltransferase
VLRWQFQPSDIMNEITIIDATRDDGPAILALLENSNLPTAGLSEHLDSAIVARRNGTLVGAAALEAYGDSALLRSVVVAPSERGTRVGHCLMASALSRAKSRGVQTVYLLTTTAEHFFPRFGFETIGRSEVPVGVQTSVEFTSACPATAVVMRKRLE